ncbi:Putative phosphatidylinositol N-acetylglucosaminyltransferase subunit Y [Septoria linicola]|uniref:Phosphatidylinositol N-acetylglucosaminyltransferase subunit Y n=1 Tax=Septoria linicola TaxID=215465 RepID=A0A9Q9AUA4_9PEZI|nr:putative phosphatidylinositol N-acetylglucosaminyltransferase subunit Y [Septoria linicola]USW55265.1 Putative phosphatidylinositol N-acetylglucosaminyltransferase subunit Y [Septoria linicola]
MEDSKSGSYDRRRSGTTVSGPVPALEDATSDNEMRPSSDSMKLLWTSPSAPTSPAEKPAGSSPSKRSEHRRSISGNILAKFNFLNRLSEDGRPPSREKESELKPPKSPRSSKSRKSIDDDEPTTSPVSPLKGEGAMAAALKATKSRKRKGSLRKTALLGTRRLVTETRERRNSVLQRVPSTKQVQQTQAARVDDLDHELKVQPPLAREASSSALNTQSSYENVQAASSSESGWLESAAATSARLSLLTDHRPQHEQRKPSAELKSPLDLKSPESNASYASTTDDDDVLTFGRPANNYISQLKPVSSAATSYFPESSLSRRQSSKHSRSPLSQNLTSALSTFPSSPLTQEPHDYTETEYWGWVILVVTWLIFTVGMGSCLEIWSWAWDVGETPYAPPELEDDPTLPIVGYYPALIVLTGVVAWVWITVAWIGMKYFRHAKIEV